MTAPDIRALLQERSSSRKLDKSRPVFIYGAGKFGRGLSRILRSKGYNICAFIDQRASQMGDIDGVPVHRLNEIDLGSSQIVIGVFNRDVCPHDLHESLQTAGAAAVFDTSSLSYSDPSLGIRNFWLDPVFDYSGCLEQVTCVLNLLSDEPSVQTYSRAMKYHISGSVAYAPKGLGLTGQYFETGIPGWLEFDAIHMLDCGAYDGDSIRAAFECGLPLRSVVALEPDLENFRQLSTYVQGIPGFQAILFPCGAWDTTSKVTFASGHEEGSRIGAGEESIFAVRLDDVLVDRPVNFVKLDVEGAEVQALRGMRHLLDRHRPHVAVSLYHLPQDMWDIPLLLRDLLTDYRYYVRQHGHNTMELVLYCLPA